MLNCDPFTLHDEPIAVKFDTDPGWQIHHCVDVATRKGYRRPVLRVQRFDIWGRVAGKIKLVPMVPGIKVKRLEYPTTAARG